MKRKYAPVTSWIIIASLLAAMCASLTFSQRTAAQSTTGNEVANEVERPDAAYPMLSKYATDLTLGALKGKLGAVREHDMDVARVIAALAAAGKTPVVVGESDLARDAIARGVAIKIAFGDVPDSLRDKRVFRLSLDALAKGAQTSEEFVNRVHSVFAEAAQAEGRVILFVDQLHEYAGARANASASAIVKEAIGANQLRLIGGASPEAYSSYIASDENVAKLFESIAIDTVADNASAPTSTDKRRSPINQEFVGESISSDMRELMNSAGPNGRVNAILQVNDVDNREVRSLLARHGVRVADSMTNLGAMRVELPVQAIEALMKSGSMNYISPDRQMHSFGHVTATTGTDLIRTVSSGGLLGLLGSTTTFDGKGIGIAVIDSGIDEKHKAFASRIVFKKDFTVENKSDKDYYGHGSHVAGAAAGTNVSNSGSGNNQYQGIAPSANIINLRVLDKNGVGSVSVLLNAMNWILTPADPTKPVSWSNPLNKDKYNIRVVNMSLGAPAIDSYRNDPVCRAARALVDAGIVVVAAAGNNGKDANSNKVYGQIHAPGNEPSVITVGAANTFGTDSHADDVVASYSSRGPTRSSYVDENGIKHFDNVLKPELVAPGNKLIFAESDDGPDKPNLIVMQNPHLDSGITDDDNKKLMYLSGTSMATPVVAGAAALMLQANPKLTPNMVKMLMMYTADPLTGFNMLEQGSGELNVAGAMQLAKLVRTDLTSNTAQGSPMLTGSAPNPQTKIGGNTFTWSQGIVLKHWYATGTALIANYQTYYGLGVVLGEGIIITDGVVLGDGIIIGEGVVLSDGVVLGDSIFTSAGVVLGDGTVFCDGVVLGDGIIIGEGVVLGDGVLRGDGVVLSDGVVLGDAVVQAMSAMIDGDDTASMKAGK